MLVCRILNNFNMNQILNITFLGPKTWDIDFQEVDFIHGVVFVWISIVWVLLIWICVDIVWIFRVGIVDMWILCGYLVRVS